MIRSEYIRFLETITEENTSPEVRRMANLVMDHLDALVPLSTAQGRRIRKIVELAQTHWSEMRTEIQPAPQHTDTRTHLFTRLKSLSVGPFRGFAKQEDFDLDSQLVLIYGPNGTGKSSFCEALELGLLGAVAEAESKRLSDRGYFKNLHTDSFTPPRIVGIDSNGNEIAISENEGLYRFCFVEKNRIENFSRIAAQAPARQTELISTLFGLDTFYEFVRNFTDSMDGRYIDLEGVKAKDLAKKRELLAGYQQQLTTTIPEVIQDIESEEREVAKTYREGSTFPELVSELQGTDEKSGLIKELEDELQKQLPQKSNVTLSGLETLIQAIEADVDELELKQGELSKSSQLISFKQLYEAVTQVRESSTERCPACQTPLAEVTVNPFDHANAELSKLEHLSRLEEQINNLHEGIVTSLNKLSGLINICCFRNKENNPLFTAQFPDGQSPTIDWWKSLCEESGDVSNHLQQLRRQIESLEIVDKEIDEAINKRSGIQSRLNHLRDFEKKIVAFKSRRESAESSKRRAEEAIARFDTDNAALIADVEAEKATVTQNQSIATAYADFVQKLKSYRDELPTQLVADLGEKVVEFYNAFNRNDPDQEKLANIRLPVSQSQRLEISFNRNPGHFFDALHILSEGHIRCIGLAILTAKNLKENCPLLILDDPVNAIDDDHRDSIRRTLFEDSYFDGKQILLTCHGEEFFKDIQNLLPAERAGKIRPISFLPRNGNVHICVDFHCEPRNYIIAARSHFQRSEIRDALDKARKALESLAKGKIWRYVAKYGDSNLSIKMRSATAPIELRNLAEQLKLKIDNPNFVDVNKNSILSPIRSLLGINGESREWRYLNKGTHEEENRAEFDRQTVNEIISVLEAIDNAL